MKKAILVAALFAIQAHADFPTDQTKAAALNEVVVQIGRAKTKLNVADGSIAKDYARSQDLANATVLTEVATRTNVYSTLQVVVPYVKPDAGGEYIASISVKVRVELITKAETGDILSTKATVLERTLAVNKPF